MGEAKASGTPPWSRPGWGMKVGSDARFDRLEAVEQVSQQPLCPLCRIIHERNSSPSMCFSRRSGTSSRRRLSKSTFLARCSRARVQCATICTISATKDSSVVTLPYQLCTKSRRMMARKAYNWRSTSLRLVSGGNSSSIGAWTWRFLSPSC